MTRDEAITDYPLPVMFKQLIAWLDSNPLEDNVVLTKKQMRGLIKSAKIVSLAGAEPRYDIFLIILDFIRVRVDAGYCQTHPMLCGFYKRRFLIIPLFDFTRFD